MAVMIVIESLKLAQRLLQSAKKNLHEIHESSFRHCVVFLLKIVASLPEIVVFLSNIVASLPKIVASLTKLHPWPILLHFD